MRGSESASERYGAALTAGASAMDAGSAEMFSILFSSPSITSSLAARGNKEVANKISLSSIQAVQFILMYEYVFTVLA